MGKKGAFMSKSEKENKSTTTLSIGGGSYILIAIGVGMAVSSWGTSLIMSIVQGLFWPATLAYWLTQMLHRLAGGVGV